MTRGSKSDARRRWFLSGCVTLVVGLIVVKWIRPPSNEASHARLKPAPVLLARIPAGEATLRDKTPLFLPTEWNTSQKGVELPESGGSLAAYDSKWHFAPAELKATLPSPVVVPANAAEALTIPSPGPLFEGLGRTDLAFTALPTRSAFVEIAKESTGQRVLEETVPAGAFRTGVVWQPLEFLATVDVTGEVGLIPTARSGVDEIDAYFGKYLKQTTRIGARLPPGFYRISVGP